MVVEITALQAMTTEELEKFLAQEQEGLQVLDGVYQKRVAQIDVHYKAIRSLQDTIFNSIPARAEARVGIFLIQALLAIRTASS